MDYKELIGKLERVANGLQEDNAPKCAKVCIDAATAIETLLAEREALIEALGRFCDEAVDGCDLCKHFPCAPKNSRCVGWEWRGPADL